MSDLIIGETNVTKLIGEYISKQKDKWVFMQEIPEERYFDVSAETIKVLTNGFGYSGIYISLHRPYDSLVSSLKEKGVDTSKLVFIDAASSQAETSGKETEKCIYISKELKVDELTRAIYTLLPKINGEKKFLFLDSITTLTLYQPLSETLRFAEFLSRSLTNKEVNGVIVNVAKNLAQKKFIQDIMLNVDEVIEIGNDSNEQS